MKAKIIEKKIRKWSEFLAEAAICKAKVFPVGTQFVYDEGSLPSGMTGISAGDILNLQRENGMSSYDVPGSAEDWVRIDGNPGDGSGLDLTVEQTLTAAQKQAVAQNINDRPAQVDSETETVVSMGYKVLNPNLSFAEQVESTQTVDNSNMIFEIKDSFDLSGNVTIPANSTLKFNGGMINGSYTLIGNNTNIEANLTQIFSNNIVLKGTWNFKDIYPEWFGAKGDGVTDDITALQKAVDCALWRGTDGTTITSIILQQGRTYCVSQSLLIYPFVSLGGNKNVHRNIAPKIKSLVDGIDVICLSYYVTGASRIYIHDLAISGNSATDNGKAICFNDNSHSLGNSVFENIVLSNIKFGIYADVTTTIAEIDIKRIYATTDVGLPISLVTTSYMWGINICDCHFSLTSIGGIRLNSDMGATIPINIYNNSFDHCGTKYNLIDYSTYGTWAINVKLGYGICTIRDNYFETNCPLKKSDDDISTYDNFVEGKTSTGYLYITNPDFSKTAEIVFRGGGAEGPMLNVIRNHFSVNYQTLSVVNGGVILFENNEIMVPGESAYGVAEVGFPIQKSIAYLQYTDVVYEPRFKITIRQNNKTGDDSYSKYITDGVNFANEYAINRTYLDINIPNYSFIYNYNGGHSEITFSFL